MKERELNVGDTVRIKSVEWFESHHVYDTGGCDPFICVYNKSRSGCVHFKVDMKKYCGMELVVEKIEKHMKVGDTDYSIYFLKDGEESIPYNFYQLFFE